MFPPPLVEAMDAADLPAAKRLLDASPDNRAQFELLLRYLVEIVPREDLSPAGQSGHFEADLAAFVCDRLYRINKAVANGQIEQLLASPIKTKNAAMFTLLGRRLDTYRCKGEQNGFLALLDHDGTLGRKCLHAAITSNNPEVAKWLLGQGVSPNEGKVWTAALYRANAHFLRLLLAHDADLKVSSHGGIPFGTLLHSWITIAKAEIDIFEEDPNQETHPALDFLLDLGVDPSEKNSQGHSAQAFAVMLGIPGIAAMIDRALAHRAAQEIDQATTSSVHQTSPKSRL